MGGEGDGDMGGEGKGGERREELRSLGTGWVRG